MPNAVFYPGRHEYLCPTCGKYLERGELAEDHLISLLKPLVNTWYTQWRARDLGEAEAKEVLEHVAANRLLEGNVPRG